MTCESPCSGSSTTSHRPGVLSREIHNAAKARSEDGESDKEWGAEHKDFTCASVSEIKCTVWKQYLFGAIAVIANGATYPLYGIVFAKGISAFPMIDPTGTISTGVRIRDLCRVIRGNN